MVKLLHCADLHMGALFPDVGRRRGNLLREAQKKTWCNLLHFAGQENVDLVLVAGDLFDSNYLSSATVDFFLQSLEKTSLPICVLPGTHDPYDRNSLYRSSKFSGYENLFIFTKPEVQSLCFPDMGLTVHARASFSSGREHSPLKGLKPSGKTRYNVAVAHGGLKQERKDPDAFPFRSEEIEASGMDYIALGHDHNFRELTAGRTRAFYPGPLETLRFGQEAGNALLITLEGDSVFVEKKRVGHFHWKEISLDISSMTEKEIEEQLLSHKGQECLLRVIFHGMIPFYRMNRLDALKGHLDGYFFYLDFQFVHLSCSDRLPEKHLPGLSLPGEFHRLMQEKIRNAAPEDRKIYEEALWQGYALLTEEST